MKHFVTGFLILVSINLCGQRALHIYGGQGHDIYLGCLDCDSYNTNSIWNEYGVYGSKLNAKSIWNEYGNYGGEYSNTSPFNPYASYPPVIVDKDGGFYGYLTVNEYKEKRAQSKLALIICKYWRDIKDDVSGWYRKIFN